MISKYQRGMTASDAGNAADKALTASKATSAGQRGSVSRGGGLLESLTEVVPSVGFAGFTRGKLTD